MLRRTLLGLTALGIVAGLHVPEAKAEWPEKPIRVIVPFKPGGRTDTVARLIGKAIEEQNLLPQPFVIVNMAGGGGAIAGREVLNAEPDGHTILHWHHQMLIANAMDIVDFGPEDFTSIGFAGGGSPVWAVRRDSGLETFADLQAKLQAEPGSLVEVIGIGTIPHFVGALLGKEAGFETRKVQGNSGADRLKLIAGGNADISLFAASEFLNAREAGGGLEALIFFGPNRIDQLPDVPTAKELGFNVTWANPNWWLAPKGTPDEVVEKLAGAIEQAMQAPEIKEYFAKSALDHYWTDGPTAHDESVALLEQLKAVAADIK